MWYFILPAIIWFFLVLRIDVLNDYHNWLYEIPVKHKRKSIIRALFLLPSILLLCLPLPMSVWKILIVIGLEAFTYLLFFDGWYNLKRKQNWWFLGTVDEDDAWWDRVQRKLPLRLLKILKIGIPLMLGIIYLLTLEM